MEETKTAIVTGAGSGVGRATSILLADAGYNVVLAARTEDKLRETAEQCAGECLMAPTDICDPAAARALVDSATEAFGRLDAVANIAGLALLAPIAEGTAEQWRQTIDTNLSSVVNLTAAAMPVLGRQGGVIVNVSSMASIDPFPGFAMYAAAKAGLNMFTLVTAREGAQMGVTAVTIAPGAIETPMLRGLFDETVIPQNQTLQPQEVAKSIADCIIGRREFESGEVIEMPSA